MSALVPSAQTSLLFLQSSLFCTPAVHFNTDTHTTVISLPLCLLPLRGQSPSSSIHINLLVWLSDGYSPIFDVLFSSTISFQPNPFISFPVCLFEYLSQTFTLAFNRSVIFVLLVGSTFALQRFYIFALR